MTPARNPTRTLPLPALISLFVVAAVLLGTAPYYADDGTLRLVSEICLVIAMAQMWNLLSGFTGLLSFGHQAFVGIGAYAAFAVSNGFGLSPYISLLAAPIAAGVAAAIFATVLFRLRDAYFAISIWVVAEVLAIAVSKVPGFGGQLGMTLTSIRGLDFATFLRNTFWISGSVALGSIALCLFVLRSDLGLGLGAVRNNETAARSLGIDAWRMRFVVLVISGAGVGLAGAVYFMSSLQVVPSAAFDLNWMVMMLFITIIGGIGRIEGPLIGAAIYFGMREFFADYGGWYLVATGAVGVVVMLLAPQGLWGLVERLTGVELFGLRRKIPDHLSRTDGKPQRS